MAKTIFVDGTVVLTDFLNSIFGSGPEFGHVHNGGDEDGNCRKIQLDNEVEGELAVANMVKQDIDSGTTGQLPASRIDGLATSGFFLGEYKPYHGTTSPSAEWLVCDGGAIPAGAEYDAFRTFMGGSTTPNHKGKALFGYDATNPKFDSIVDGGQTNYVGEETHVNTEQEMPTHAHSFTTFRGTGSGQTSGLASGGEQNGQSTSDAGGGLAHNNMPPYGVATMLIRAIA